MSIENNEVKDCNKLRFFLSFVAVTDGNVRIILFKFVQNTWARFIVLGLKY